MPKQNQFLFLKLFLILTLTNSVIAAKNKELRDYHLSIQDLKNSKQILLLVTPNLKSVKGKLQKYERLDKNKWKKIGDAVPIALGRNGLAFSRVMMPLRQHGEKIKYEGDGCTPLGIFRLGPAFGFEKKPDCSIKFPYLYVTDKTVCVNDSNSRYYNQIIDYSKVKKIDWKTSERMSEIPQYYFGSVIQYNMHPTLAGAGSCIFLHSWEKLPKETSGCVIMDLNNLMHVLGWLNVTKHPVLVIVTKSIYKKIKSEWELPDEI